MIDVNIGEPTKEFEIEPLVLPVPEILPEPEPAPEREPVPERKPAPAPERVSARTRG